MVRRWSTWLTAVVIVLACVACGRDSAGPAPACPPANARTVPGPGAGTVAPPAPVTTTPTGTPTGPPAGLALAVTPSAVVLDGLQPQPVIVAVADTGAGRIDNLSVRLFPPAGVEWRPESPVERLTLGPQDRVVIRGALVGRRTVAGSTSVVAEGRAVDTGRTVVEVATVDHQPAPPLATLSVTGGDKVSNSRNLDLLAVLVNGGDGPITATVHGASTNPGKIKVSVTCPQVVGAGDSAVFAVTVDGADLRSGSETATVTADVDEGAGGPADHLVATHSFDTSPFGDTTLVGPLGLSSLLLLPGIAAVLTWSVVRVYPRRRRGVVTSALPDLRSLGTAISVVLASAGAVEAYRLLGGESLYDGYSTWSLALVTVLAWLAALVAGAGRWFYIEQRYPVLDADSEPRDALAALRSWSLPADTVEGLLGRVVWVHDGAACAVSGIEVRGTITGTGLDDALARKDLRQLQRIVKDNPTLDVAYVAGPGSGPGDHVAAGDPAVAGARTGAVKDDFRPQGRAPVITHSVAV